MSMICWKGHGISFLRKQMKRNVHFTIYSRGKRHSNKWNPSAGSGTGKANSSAKHFARYRPWPIQSWGVRVLTSAHGTEYPIEVYCLILDGTSFFWVEKRMECVARLPLSSDQWKRKWSKQEFDGKSQWSRSCGKNGGSYGPNKIKICAEQMRQQDFKRQQEKLIGHYATSTIYPTDLMCLSALYSFLMKTMSRSNPIGVNQNWIVIHAPLIRDKSEASCGTCQSRDAVDTTKMTLLCNMGCD